MLLFGYVFAPTQVHAEPPIADAVRSTHAPSQTYATNHVSVSPGCVACYDGATCTTCAGCIRNPPYAADSGWGGVIIDGAGNVAHGSTHGTGG